MRGSLRDRFVGFYKQYHLKGEGDEGYYLCLRGKTYTFSCRTSRTLNKRGNYIINK